MSITYFNLIQQGKVRIGDLSNMELMQLSRFIDRSVLNELRSMNLKFPLPRLVDYKELVPCGNTLVNICQMTSKAIRNAIEVIDPICIYKCGLMLTPNESLTWLNNLNKVTSIRHKSIILRVAHGDIYTKEKLHRFALIDAPNCPRCGQIETLQHKVMECDYVKRIWSSVTYLSNKLRLVDNPTEDPEKTIMGAGSGSNQLIIAIHAEILNRIVNLRDDETYLMRPQIMAKLSIETIIKNERNPEIKNLLASILQ